MTQLNEHEPSFWSTVWLLLRSARRRFQGRKGRQQQLLNQRTGKSAVDWGWLGTALGVLFMIVIQGLAVGTLYFAILTGERLSTEQHGKIVVSQNFLFALKTAESAHVYRGVARQDAVNPKVYQS